MNIESFFWLSLGIILLVALGISIKKRSFEPLTGEIYLIAFFGVHLFEVRLGDQTAKFFQKLPFYILFWPFNRISFIYEWVQEMTYSDYLKKKKKAEDDGIIRGLVFGEFEFSPIGFLKARAEGKLTEEQLDFWENQKLQNIYYEINI
jgi:hypothetical protein